MIYTEKPQHLGFEPFTMMLIGSAIMAGTKVGVAAYRKHQADRDLQKISAYSKKVSETVALTQKHLDEARQLEAMTIEKASQTRKNDMALAAAAGLVGIVAIFALK